MEIQSGKNDIRYVLALDTAMAGCAAAVLDAQGGALTQNSEAMARGQAKMLVPMIQDTIAAAGIEFKDIGLIAVTIGPGTFTGLRIGLATARTLSLALGIPLAGVTTLETLSHSYFAKEQGRPPDHDLLTVLETKRKDFYFQRFDAGGLPVTEPDALEAADIAVLMQGGRFVLIGDAAHRLAAALPETGMDYMIRDGYELPDPGVMAALAFDDYMAGNIRSAEPLYLRGADVSRPKKPQRRIEGQE